MKPTINADGVTSGRCKMSLVSIKKIYQYFSTDLANAKVFNLCTRNTTVISIKGNVA